MFLDPSSVIFTPKQMDKRFALGQSDVVSDSPSLVELLVLWRLYKPQVQKNQLLTGLELKFLTLASVSNC